MINRCTVLIALALFAMGVLGPLPVVADEAGVEPTHVENRSRYLAAKATSAPNIDGIADEKVWDKVPWRAISHRWLGPEFSASDFAGRFKVVWTEEKLFILAELVDDVLLDQYRDPLVQYWDDDCLEIFLDEDYSGGEHHYSHNAFAYHMLLDNRAVDIGTDKLPRDYSHHVTSRWRQKSNTIVWELAIDIYSDSYSDKADDALDSVKVVNTPVSLSAGKLLGLMIAYCDNDGTPLRENFIGSESVPHGPTDRGYKDAGLFGAVVLVDDGNQGALDDY
jgi:hypothetical protein